MPHDVFICHAAENKAVADAACHVLEESGLRCWIAPRDVPPGSEWAGALVEAIEGSRVMLVIVSAGANASPQVLREVAQAVNKGVVILPFRIEDVLLSKSLQFLLSSQHWMDALTPPLAKHLDALASAIHALLGTPLPAAAARRRRSRTGPRRAVVSAIVVILLAGAAAVWRPWASRDSGRPSDWPRAVADPPLAALLGVVARLDSLAVSLLAGFSDASLAQAFSPPPTVTDRMAAETWILGSAGDQAQAARSLERDAEHLMQPIDELQSADRATLIGAVDVGRIEQDCRKLLVPAHGLRDEAERFQKELEHFRSIAQNSATDVGLATRVPLGSARLAGWREDLSEAIKEAWWDVDVALDARITHVPDARKSVEEALTQLQSLQPRTLIDAGRREALRDTSKASAKAARDAYDAKAAEPDPADAALSEAARKLASDLDNFIVLDSDTAARVITKAVGARNARRIGDSLAAFDEYARRFADRDVDAPNFARIGKLFTTSDFARETISAVYVYFVAEDSPAKDTLRPGDIILEADCTKVTNADQFANILHDHAGRLMPLRVLRETADHASLAEQQLDVHVPAAAALHIGLSKI